MFRRHWGLWVLVFIMLLSICGCKQINGVTPSTEQSTSLPNETEEKYMLSDRQKEILSSNGLPTVYEELDPYQQGDIRAIEDMLCYLEANYDDEFKYAGYVKSSAIDKEHLIASSAKYPFGEVVVYRQYINHEFVYEDNYYALAATPIYEETVDQWLSEYINNSQYIVFASVSSAEEKIQESQILAQASASLSILISEDSCNEDNLYSIATQYGNWIKENSAGRQSSTTLLYLVPFSSLEETNLWNYETVISELKDPVYYWCVLSKQGNLKVYRGGE